MWWQRNSKGETEPGERQIGAFASIAKMAQQHSVEQQNEKSTAQGYPTTGEGAGQNCIKRR